MAGHLIKKFSVFTKLTGLVLVLLLADIIAFSVLPLSLLYPDIFLACKESGPEAAAVLFNDFNGDFTGVNRETRRRLNLGLALLRSNRVERLIVAGGNRAERGLSGARMMADYLLEQGVPSEDLLIEDRSLDSISNLARIENLAKKHSIRTLGLVSSPYHLMRLQRMIGSGADTFACFPYDPLSCSPPLTRREVWFSAHYNLAAGLLHIILPEQAYKTLVFLVRKHTDW